MTTAIREKQQISFGVSDDPHPSFNTEPHSFSESPGTVSDPSQASPTKSGAYGSNQAADIHSYSLKTGAVSDPSRSCPTLPEGWHESEKYGPVYVSPGGKAWTVQIIRDRLENVIVDVSVNDFIGKSAIELRKDAVRKAARRTMTKVSRTTPPILTPSVGSKDNDGVSEATR